MRCIGVQRGLNDVLLVRVRTTVRMLLLELEFHIRYGPQRDLRQPPVGPREASEPQTGIGPREGTGRD